MNTLTTPLEESAEALPGAGFEVAFVSPNPMHAVARTAKAQPVLTTLDRRLGCLTTPPLAGLTNQLSTAGRAPNRVEITRTAPPGCSVAVRGYPAVASQRSNTDPYPPG